MCGRETAWQNGRSDSHSVHPTIIAQSSNNHCSFVEPFGSATPQTASLAPARSIERDEETYNYLTQQARAYCSTLKPLALPRDPPLALPHDPPT